MRVTDETVVMPARKSLDTPGRTPRDVGARLALLRRLHDLDQKKMAESISVTQGTYSNWETGARPLGIESAHALCDKYDMSLDWLYRGTKGRLPFELEKALNALKATLQTNR